MAEEESEHGGKDRIYLRRMDSEVLVSTCMLGIRAYSIG